MCGICGIYGAGGVGTSARETTRAMCGVIVHRGPDDDGFYFDDNVALGMRRLSIIDLVTGGQPIHNEDQTVWTVYNGEIYNFPELKKGLLAAGHVFTTNTDTEVFVHLYEDLGPDFVKKLNGMFAIALWDTKLKRLILARDRVGVKPLHYLRLGGRLYFGSEIKSLLQTGLKREMDAEALSQFFTFEYIPAPGSIFKGIQKLLPAQMMIVQNGKSEILDYWSLSYRHPEKALAEEEYAEEIRRRLRESVRLRLISDVPLGVFLSGGMDSSTITALMKETGATDIKTFSIGFKEKSFNELDYARRVADFLGTTHTEFTVESGQVKDLVPRLMNYLDEPLADASVIPTFIISRLARRYVTVALAGDGGDELFGGYDTYKAYQIARLYRKVPGFLRAPVRAAVRLLPASKKRLSFEFKAKKFLSGIDFPPEVANFIWWGAYLPAERAKLFSAELNDRLRGDPFSPVWFHARRAPDGDMLDRLGYLDIKLYLQDDLLVKVDRMSMANSLEIRVPFLDYTFIEYAASIPGSLKLKGLTTKYILKKSMAKVLPSEVLTRKKIGFDIPLGVWIRQELREFVQDVLSPANLKKHGFFNPDYVQKILSEHLKGTHNHRQLLWPLIIFQFWYDHYLS